MECKETEEMKEIIEFVSKVFEAIKEPIIKMSEHLKKELPFLIACSNNPKLCRLACSKKKRVAKKNYNRLMKIAYGRRG